jgi:isoquinoline 1-oxidoreductase beta subunit
MLVQATAQAWDVPAGEIRVERGVLSHPASGRSGGFGEFADAAAKVQPPAEMTLKDPSAWVYIGDEKLRRLDSVAKTTGAQQFPIDVYLPGMLTAVIERPPLFGA